MEKEIKAAASEFAGNPYFYSSESGKGADNIKRLFCEMGFEEGAEWMLKQYNGIAPETVKEMILYFESYDEWVKHYGNNGMTPQKQAYKNLKEVFNKAKKEIANK